MSAPFYVTPPVQLRGGHRTTFCMKTNRGITCHLFLAEPLDLAEDEVVRFALNETGAILGVRVEQLRSAA